MTRSKVKKDRLRDKTVSVVNGCLSFVPVFLEQIEENPLAGVFSNKLFSQRHSEAGLIRQIEVTINNLGIVIHRALNPGVSEIVEMFLNFEIRRAGGKVQVGRGRHRSADIVGRHEHVVRLGPRGQLARLGDSPEMRQIDLNDVARLKLKQFAALKSGVNAFAG